MAYRTILNPYTGELQLVSTGSTGSGNVTGLPPTTVTAIARWASTDGTQIENSLALVQDGGAIQAQGFVFNRQILNDVYVPNHHTIISTDVELVSGDITLSGDAQLLLV